MTEDTLLPFDLPAVQRKKVTADFADGSISSNGVGYIFGLAGNAALHGLAYETADDLKECRAVAGGPRCNFNGGMGWACTAIARVRGSVSP